MDYPKPQIEQLKAYCRKLGVLQEGGVTFFSLEGLRLPTGCEPQICDALLCPTSRDQYPSRLFLSIKVKSPYDRNWNCENARIGEKNWFAFSWNVEGTNLTLLQILTGHLLAFTKPK
jgi:hypothetical protein